jgi:hypothetical protein
MRFRQQISNLTIRIKKKERDSGGGKEKGRNLGKKGSNFPGFSQDVTNQTHPGRELLKYSPPWRFWLVTSRLGTGKSLTFFYNLCPPPPLEEGSAIKPLKKLLSFWPVLSIL